MQLLRGLPRRCQRVATLFRTHGIHLSALRNRILRPLRPHKRWSGAVVDFSRPWQTGLPFFGDGCVT